MQSSDCIWARKDIETALPQVQGQAHGGYGQNPKGQARIAAAAGRLDRTAAARGEQFRRDVPQGEKDAVGQRQDQRREEQPPQSEIPVEFILSSEGAMHHEEHTRGGDGKGHATEDAIITEPQEEYCGHDEDRAQRVMQDHGMDADMINESSNFCIVSLGRCPPTLLTREDDPKLTMDYAKGELRQLRMVANHDTDDCDFKEILAIVTRDIEEEMRSHDREIVAVVRSLGGSEQRCRKERRKASKAVVSEIYSLPRASAACKFLPELEVLPGVVLDLTTADFDGSLWESDAKEMRSGTPTATRGKAHALRWITDVHGILDVAEN